MPRKADAISGGELSQASARSTEANSDEPAVCAVAMRIDEDVVDCDTSTSPARGAPIAVASMATVTSLLHVIGLPLELDRCLVRLRGSAPCAPPRQWSDKVDLSVDVATRGLRVGAGLMCLVDQSLGHFPINARYADIEAGT